MRVFRLARKKYGLALSGKGAARSGNRWNSKGTEIVYTSDSRALAMAEVAVHLTWETLPPDYVMLEIEIPETVGTASLAVDDLPKGWSNWPHRRATQAFGDRFIEAGEHAVLRVPSAVVPGDFNHLINPRHPDFQRIKRVAHHDFPWDERLFNKT